MHRYLFKEFVSGISLLVVGGILLSGHATSLAPAVGLFAVFGLFHGSAFGDTMAQHIHARLAGAVVAGVGTFLTLENIEGLVFNMLGLAA